MNPRRIDVGPLLVLAGAVALLVSLFLDWFDPGVTAWEAFEVLDLVLAATAITAALIALGLAGARIPAPEPHWMAWTAGLALLLVLATLADHPPATRGADSDTGLWIALAGSALMAAGALLTMARVRISLDVEGRRRRTTVAGARRDDDPTRPIAPPPPPDSRL